MQMLLDQLRKREIDLKEFCRRVRLIIGEAVLTETVQGLQRAQTAQAEGAAAASAAATNVRMPDALAATQVCSQARGALPTAIATTTTTTVGKGQALTQMGAAPLPIFDPPTDIARSASDSGSGHTAKADTTATKSETDSSSAAATLPNAKGLGTKVLVHALLCPRVRCAVPTLYNARRFLPPPPYLTASHLDATPILASP
jgi:hypothetical protein